MTENNGLDALKQQIKEFIKQDTPEIFALTGTWGVGKTFALRNVIAELKKENDTKKHFDDYAYVSLFGLKEIKDVKFKIIGSLLEQKSSSLKEKYTPSALQTHTPKTIQKLIGKCKQLVSKNISKAIHQVAKIFHADGLTELVQYATVDIMLTGKIICFDDFERTSINTQELLGFLQDLKEERNCKIILIYNEEKIEDEAKKKAFNTCREKVIDKHFDYTPSSTQTVELAFKGKQNEKPFTNIQNYQAFIAEKCEALKLNNIRIIQKILNHINKDIQPILEKVTWSSDIYPDMKKEVTEHIISAIILYAFLYFQGDYKNDELSVSKDEFEKHINNKLSLSVNISNKEERDKIYKKQDWIDKFVLNKQYKEILKNVILLLQAGYLLDNQKDDLKKILTNFINQTQNLAESLWRSITRERHTKLVSNDYPQRFYHAAKDIASSECIENVSFMVNFLQEHNMSIQAQEITDLFIQGIVDYKKKELYEMRSLHINNTPDLIKACRERFEVLKQSLISSISLEDALTKISVNKGYNPEDMDRVKNAKSEEIKSFLLSNSEYFSSKGATLIELNPQIAIPALYEIYQEANKPQKNQIRANEIFGNSLREALKNDNLDKNAKDMIAEMLQSNR